jgi:hypothetical protein
MVEVSTSDVVVFQDGTVTPLTDLLFIFSGGRNATKTGDFALYRDTVAFLYGNRDHKKQVQQLLWLEQLRFLIKCHD